MRFNKVHLRVRYHQSAPTQSLCLRSKFENRGQRQSRSGVRRGRMCCESFIVFFNILRSYLGGVIVNCANMIEPMSASAVNELESWVELNSGVLSGGNEYIKLLGEAQRESRDSSVRHSRASSVKGSPKSPPNSPNLEPSTEDELKGVYINCWRDDSNDWVWEWSSRPDQMPPKDWRFKHPPSARGPPSATSSIEVLEQLAPAMTQSERHCLSVRRLCLFSRGALAAVLVTNVLSLLVGAGIGVWLSKRGLLPPRLVLLC